MRNTISSLAAVALAALSGCSPAQPPPAAPSSESSGADDGSPMKLVAQSAKGIGDPEIEISNTADEPFSIEISGPSSQRVDVPGNESRKIKIPAGNYVFRIVVGEVPNDQPFTFARDMRYRFTVRLILEIDDPKFAGKGYECFDTKRKPVYSGCSRRVETCKVSRAHVPTELATSECTHRAEMFFFRAKSNDGKPMALFEPTAAECEALRKMYIDQKAGTDVGACEAGK